MRNLHIVNVPVPDMADAVFNKNYVYVQIYTTDKVEMQIQIIADPDQRRNARDFLFATIQSQELAKECAEEFKTIGVKQVNIEEFNPIDEEPEYDESADPASLGPDVLCGSGYCIAHEGFSVERKHTQANKSLTVAWIHERQTQRLLVESFAYLPFLDYSQVKKTADQHPIVYEGIYIFNLNNQYAIQFSASRDFEIAIGEFLFKFKQPTIADRGAALYYMQQLRVSERRTVVVNEQDLMEIRDVCAGAKTDVLNLKTLNLAQQVLVEAYLSCRDYITRPALFDTAKELSILRKDDPEYFDDLFQPIDPPTYIVYRSGKPE